MKSVFAQKIGTLDKRRRRYGRAGVHTENAWTQTRRQRFGVAGRKTRERERREREHARVRDARVRKKRERRSERSERVTRVTTLWRGVKNTSTRASM